ncbi:S-layer domain-containing protein [Caldicellulosiruptor acetigenus I77R1B]|uniref:S-layer domain-containing protein n=1 Tax=Caldicellulosiruptor acetigenus (strain ATCC 700853 / DSM 12137 / I77R1B) TaxID=632335 RepID=E4S6Z0_CALA7|nr:S-layer homology domain-containing protein [Caldicellulosiruptor acetigenus]ADQ41773.1 S-layer domain-containing protein [Caldicellulosiruptor acetigenus I77R1B]
MRKFKRLIAILTVFLFALSIIAPAFAQDEATTEETTGSVYDQAAKILQDKGILKGNEQGDLMLDKSLTRAEILAMIIRATGQEDVVNDYVYAEQSFSDVPQDHWAFAYVEAGKDLGIVNGYPDGTFKPDKPVKFEELCKMLVAAKGESPAAGKWPLNYVRKALELGFFNGIEDEVGIGDIVIRGQAAVAFANAFFPPEKTVVVKDVKPLANDTIQVAVDVYLNNEPATLEEGDVIPLDFEIKDASDETKTVAVTQIDTEKSDFGAGKIVLKTAAQTEGATYKVYFKGQDTGKSYVAVPVELKVVKVEAVNLKQVLITFNRTVVETYAKDTNNYEVKVGDTTKTIGAAKLSEDKTKVTLSLKDNLSNNDKVKVTLKTGLGLKEAYTTEVGPVVDTTAPTLTKVTAETPQKLILEFNEPVTNYLTASNYTINGMYLVKEAKGFAEDSSIDPNVVILNLYIPLSVGSNTITVNGVTDVAGYGVINKTVSFTVQEDKSPIELKNVNATLTQIKFEFNKAIQNIVSYSLSNGSVTGTSVDGNVVTINAGDDITTCIPIAGAKVTIEVKDYAGQTAKFEKYVVPTIDTERPVVKKVEVTDATTVKITFSEDVRVPNVGDNKIKIIDKDGNQRVIQAITYDTDSSNNQIKSVLKVVLASSLPAGSVKVEVAGIEDNTPLKNASLPQVITATLADTTPPAVSSVIYRDDTSNDKTEIYITFDKTLNASTANAVSNYKYLNASYLIKDFSDASAVLQANGKTVKLVVKDSDFAEMTYLQIIGVADNNGNKLTTAVAKSTFINSDAAVVTIDATKGAKATSKTQVKVYLTGLINEYTLYAGDFEVKAGSSTIGVLYATWDAGEKAVVLNLASEIGADAKKDGNSVTVGLKANSITKDLLGRSLNAGNAFGAVSVVDAIAPTISAVDVTFSNNVTTVVVKLSENTNVTNLSPDVIKAQFKVYIGGTLTSPASVDNTNAAQIVFTFNSDERYKAVKVDYIPDYNAGNRVKDGAGNELAQTSVNGAWK